MVKSPEVNVFRMPVTLPEEVMLYLEKLSLSAKATGGKKLSNTMITRATLKALMDINLDVSGVKTEEELVERVKEAFRKI